jgi:hypothetical protein
MVEYMNTNEYQFSEPTMMKASEVRSKFVNPDRDPGQFTQKQSYRAKLSEAKSSGLYDSVKSEGVREPIKLQQPGDQRFPRIFKPQIIDGAHRLSVAQDIHPDTMVPVQFASIRKKGNK